jgi:plasmid maintenance system antidote protein VapI
MTQTEIARIIGKTQQCVSLILTGRQRPTWAVAKKLSDHFARSPAWWMEASIDRIKRVLRSGKTDGSKENGGQNGQQRRAA